MTSRPSTAAQIPKRRRWLAFSLRAMLVFMLLACVVAAYFGNLWRHVQQRRATLAQLGALGFSHQYNFDPEGEDLKQPPGPWIGRALIGDDAYATVKSIHSSYQRSNAIDDLRLLADLPETREVQLWGDWVTDEAVEHLAKVHGLEELELIDTKITPAGFERLASLRTLRHLNLIGPDINDAAFTHLHELPNLLKLEVQASTLTSQAPTITPVGMARIGTIASLREVLFASVNGVDAEALRHLSQIRELDGLTMSGVTLDEPALREICCIKSLKMLSLYDCGLTDEASPRLADLTELEYLSLGDMPLGDGCIDAILSLRKLECVSFSECQITEEGFLKLVDLPRLRQISVEPAQVIASVAAAAAGKTFAQERPDCNVRIGAFSQRVTKYVPPNGRKRPK